MAKEKPPVDPAPPGTPPEGGTLPGMEAVGRLPSDVVRKAIYRRLTLKDALPDDPEFKRKYRYLWDWLTFTDLSEEKLKERATLIIKVAEGAWSVAITDPSMAASMAATGQTLDGVLERLDELLGDPDAPWVPSRKREAKLKDRKKK